MPPHLHPRSRLTSTLFGSTLAVCFLVVGMPHILPCPAPRTAYADAERGEDGRLRRRRKKDTIQNDEMKTAMRLKEDGEAKTVEEYGDEDILAVGNKERACPVPKPGGVLGEVLGFKEGKQKLKERGGDETK